MNTCGSKNFKALTITQFLGALNDNIFKLVISLLALNTLAGSSSGAVYLSLAGALFVLPYVLFSPYAGYFADRYPKNRILQSAKAAEIVIMGLGCWALVAQNLNALLFVLFLMGTQSAFFSPSKYGVLPEMLDESNLSKGNGYIQFWTFVAIIVGTAAGGQLMAVWGAKLFYIGLTLLLIAVVGFITSFRINKTTCAKQSRNFEVNGLKVIASSLREIRKDNDLFLALTAVAYFWFLGAFFQMNTLLYAKQILAANDQQVSLLLFSLAAGIGLGSIFAGVASEGKVEIGLVPLGAIGLSLFSMLLGLLVRNTPAAALLLFALGFCGGIFIVPLNAFIQKRSPDGSRGRFLAVINFISNIAMLLASALLWFLSGRIALDPALLFFMLGAASIAVTVIIFKKLPVAFLRCLNWLITHTFYKSLVLNKENIPSTGGALLVCNHVSYMDPPLVLAAIERPVRFLMYRSLYESPVLNPVARTMKAIPISYTDSPRTIVAALNEARMAVEGGELVCIFAEGGLTRTGQMLSFKKGLEKIMKGITAPIIPVHLDHIWGSIFSFKNGRYFWKWPEEVPYPVTISIGKPLPAQSTAYEVRLKVQELGAEAFKHRKQSHRHLHTGFLTQAKRKPWKLCMADSSGAKLNYIQALAGALLMARLFKTKLNSDSKSVGVLMPTSVAGALANLGLMIAGFIPVNLNFTASADSIASAKEQCGMKHVITAKKFIEKANLERTGDMLFLEDLTAGVSKNTKLAWLLRSLIFPVALLKKLYFGPSCSSEDIATIIFSSGSTGLPKGVMLTHGNIASNVEAIYDIVSMKKSDTILGALPFFHSFGFTGTLWLPLLAGINTVYHTSPLDAAMIGKLTQRFKASVLLSTPTFLQAYLRKCTPDQFAFLRYVIVGAEKLKDRIAKAFEEKFGIEPLEGYGATELSPFAALNVEDYRAEGIIQTGKKKGKIGHPVPGVAVKIVDPDSGSEMKEGENGLLLVKGPNVMKGYLNQPGKTAEVIRDGWYNTGDIANIDEDGFVTITDRLSRFSKIAGEMVPHIKIEEAIQETLSEVEQICAVTSIADDKKGERLAVLHTKELDVGDLRKKMSESGFPALWIPKADDFYRIDALPMLGSGKLDLKAMKQLAANLSTVTSE